MMYQHSKFELLVHSTRNILMLYSYFIALTEIHRKVCPEVPWNPREFIFSDAEDGGKYNISGIPGNRGTNVLVWYISREAMK